MCEGVKSVGGARFSGIKKIMLKRSCLKSKKLRKDNCKMKMMKRPKKMALKLAGIMMLLMLCMGMGNTAHAQTSIVPPMLKAGGSTSGAKSYQFEIKGKEILTVPVTVSKAGKVCLEASGNTEKVAIIFSTNAAPATQKDWLGISTTATGGKIGAYAGKKGTFYMHAFMPEGEEGSKTALKIKAYEIPVSVGNAGTLSKGKWVSTSGISDDLNEGGGPAFFKIKAPSSGCVKLEIKKTGKNEEYIEAAFTNSKKKKLADEIEQKGITAYYGVKKGTYYVKVDTDAAYKIRYTFETAADKKNTTKKKAVSLKQKKTVKGLFVINEKKSRWYKVKLKKTQTLKLTLNASTDKYGFWYQITDSKGKKIVSNQELPRGKKQFKKKLKAGTYYLEIAPTGATGSYSVKWN